jgi:hypothetical protein
MTDVPIGGVPSADVMSDIRPDGFEAVAGAPGLDLVPGIVAMLPGVATELRLTSRPSLRQYRLPRAFAAWMSRTTVARWSGVWRVIAPSAVAAMRYSPHSEHPIS